MQANMHMMYKQMTWCTCTVMNEVLAALCLHRAGAACLLFLRLRLLIFNRC